MVAAVFVPVLCLSLSNQADLLVANTLHLQGFFLDRAHHVPGSWKGVRIIAGEPAGTTITVMGTDDGETFWIVYGTIEREKNFPEEKPVSIDFSPKGGPADITATWVPALSTLTFFDGNTWVRVDTLFAPAGPDFGPRLIAEPSAAGELQGVFADHKEYSPNANSFAGLRFISDASPNGAESSGNAVTLIGCDDGVSFWLLSGVKRAGGSLRIDFSPKGGPPDLTTNWDAAAGVLSFSDGNHWDRVAQKGWRHASGHML